MPNELAETKLREARWYETENEQNLCEERKRAGRPVHVRPNSILIAAMGNHWHSSCYEAVHDMAEHAFKAGFVCCLWEMPDRCHRPYDALGVMRNTAYMRALQEGWEYLLYVDNDMRPEKDALVRLLRQPVPIVSPIVEYWDGQNHSLLMPLLRKNQGLVMVTSCVLSFVLFRATVFFPFALTPFWQDALGADEAYHFQRLALAGHYPFVDTNVSVLCMSAPHYPLNGLERTAEDLRGFSGKSSNPSGPPIWDHPELHSRMEP